MLNFLKKIYFNHNNKKGRRFKHSRKEVDVFLNNLGSPKDDIDRSYFQYLCQKWESETIFSSVVENLVSLFLFIPFFIFFRCKPHRKNKDRYDAVLTHEFLKDYLPQDFKGSFIWEDFNNGSLNSNDSKLIFLMIKRHPFSFFFNFKNMCRIASYSKLIDKFRPSIIFCSAEYSFTSSILTYYCELKELSHINLMHGEKQFNPRDSFFRFTKFYVWDDYYVSLFLKLKADKTFFVIQGLALPRITPNLCCSHCTYYLQLHTQEQLTSIKKMLEKVDKNYIVRPHPVYSNRLIEKVFDKDHIENQETDIWHSLENAGLVISQDSTVLYQAYISGISIVIDDMSDPDYFNELKERDYIMLNKPHKLLSELIQ